MIFITTGTQEPFDRLIKVIDTIAHDLKDEIIAQSFTGRYQPKNFSINKFYTPAEFDDIFKRARLIVSHAGMGNIINALTIEKPILVMPRKKDLGEHRNNHQIATVKKFKELGYIYIANDEKELTEKLTKLVLNDKIDTLHQVGKYASKELITSLMEYINNES